MTETNGFQLTQPGRFSDPLTEVLRLPRVFTRANHLMAPSCNSPASSIPRR